jgi:ADP-ribose pyrophosphatase
MFEAAISRRLPEERTGMRFAQVMLVRPDDLLVVGSPFEPISAAGGGRSGSQPRLAQSSETTVEEENMDEQAAGMRIIRDEERDRIGATVWRAVDVQDANGMSTKGLVSRPAAVVVLPVDEAWQRFALARQPRVGALGELVTEAPAGKVDPGETPLDAARRELEEELGIVAGWLEYVAGNLLVSPGYSDERMHLVIATHLSQGRKRDEDAGIERVWMEFAQIDTAIDNAEDLKTYAVLQEFRYRLRTGLPLQTK